MHHHALREFLPFLWSLAATSDVQFFRYDLVIKGGRVIDPSQSLSAPRDVAISGGKVARVEADIPTSEGRLTIDARGKIVTPGLVDIHVHVYDGVAPLGIPADPNCIAKGATTVVDAGSAGGPPLSRIPPPVPNTPPNPAHSPPSTSLLLQPPLP